jgi:biopolymer transport protein ExbB
MQQELVESGRVVSTRARVGLPSGEQETRTITRIGSFNAIANGDYLSYTGAVGHLQVLPRQPSADVVGRARCTGECAVRYPQSGYRPDRRLGWQLDGQPDQLPDCCRAGS